MEIGVARRGERRDGVYWRKSEERKEKKLWLVCKLREREKDIGSY